MFKNLNASALGISGHESEIIELALTYGFRAIDLDMVEFANRAKLRGMPFARRLLDSAKLAVGTFDLPLNWEADDELFKKDLEKLSEYAEVAAEIGCTRCLATLVPAGDNRPYHENFEFHRRRFGEICRVLEPSGVRLGVGFRAAEELRKQQAFQFIHELDALGLLLNMVDAANIGILLDVWDLHVAGGSIESIREMQAEQIVAVQVADAPEDAALAELTDESRLLPGATGRIDVPAILVALAELGYDGPVTAKPHKRVLQRLRRDAIAKQVGRSLETVWKAAGLTAAGTLPVAAES